MRICVICAAAFQPRGISSSTIKALLPRTSPEAIIVAPSGLGSTLLAICGCLEFFAPRVTDAELTLLAPADSVLTNNSRILFLWDADSTVETYRFQVAQPSFEAPVSLLDTLVEATRLSLTVPEGAFAWQVRAEHPGSFSVYARRLGWVDQTAPLAPILILPMNGDTVSNPVVLTWESQDNLAWASVTDSVWLYREVDSVLQLVAREVTEQKSWDLGALEQGRYVWELRSVDGAGNAGLIREGSFVKE